MKAVIELSCHSDGWATNLWSPAFYTSKNHGPHASVSVDVMGCRGGGSCASVVFSITHRLWMHIFTTAVLQTPPQKTCNVKSDKQPELICAGLSFCFLCSHIDRDDHRWCCYPPGPSSRDLTHLLLILFQPSAPLSPPVNTETLNAAQTVREKLQHAFRTLHSPTVQPARAQTIPPLWRTKSIRRVYWGKEKERTIEKDPNSAEVVCTSSQKTEKKNSR